jgi:hypothetical protein
MNENLDVPPNEFRIKSELKETKVLLTNENYNLIKTKGEDGTRK